MLLTGSFGVKRGLTVALKVVMRKSDFVKQIITYSPSGNENGNSIFRDLKLCIKYEFNDNPISN